MLVKLHIEVFVQKREQCLMMKIFFLLFCAVLIIFIKSDVSPLQKYVRIKEDFNGEVLQQYTLSSVSNCASLCKRHCQAYRYFTGNKTCILYTFVRNIQTYVIGQSATDVISFKSGGCQDDWVKVLESCYLPRFLNSDWDTASQFCTSHSGHLAVITSKDEQDDVIREFNASLPEASWIGGTYDESRQQWSWVNGEPWSYTAFGDQPKQGENCLNIYVQSLGPKRRWIANDCTIQKFALCEKPLVL